MKPRCLIVEDDPHIQRVIAWKFEAEGYEVVSTASGAEALQLIADAEPSVILLDIRLPDVDGVSVCQEARKLTSAPILMLTGEISPEVAVRALDVGANDYVRKPVDLSELAARVRAVLRAGAAEHDDDGPVALGPLFVDEANGIARYADTDLGASPTEIRLLAFMARHAGRAISKDDLLKGVWEDERDPHLIEVHVSNLRRRLQAAGCTEQIIRTVPTRGYRLDPPKRGG